MEQRKIAVFDGNFRLAAIVKSPTQLRNMMGVGMSEIQRTLSGERITCNGYYLRYIPKDIILDVDDLGAEIMLDFDEQCGLDMRIYATSKQKRSEILLESEFMKIKDSRYKRYNYKNRKK